jgi:hypothetical protein
MPLPRNTLPMMTGSGPYGPMEMGGMFSVVKVRDDVKDGDYRDPGFYKHPAGTVAYQFEGDVQAPARAAAPTADGTPLHVRKPSAHADR